jgi:hypothetical protein
MGKILFTTRCWFGRPLQSWETQPRCQWHLPWKIFYKWAKNTLLSYIYIIYIYTYYICIQYVCIYIYNLYVYIILLYNIEYWSTNHEKHSGSTNFQMPKVVISGPGFSGNIFGTIPSRGSGPVQWSKLLRLIFTPQKKQKRKGRHITVQYICMHLYTFVMCIHFYSFLSISHIQQTREKLQLKHT